jgi:hypothetical protein
MRDLGGCAMLEYMSRLILPIWMLTLAACSVAGAAQEKRPMPRPRVAPIHAPVGMTHPKWETQIKDLHEKLKDVAKRLETLQKSIEQPRQGQDPVSVSDDRM